MFQSQNLPISQGGALAIVQEGLEKILDKAADHLEMAKEENHNKKLLT